MLEDNVDQRLSCQRKKEEEYDVYRAVHRNIISTVKPTRCTKVSNLFYLE